MGDVTGLLGQMHTVESEVNHIGVRTSLRSLDIVRLVGGDTKVLQEDGVAYM